MRCSRQTHRVEGQRAELRRSPDTRRRPRLAGPSARVASSLWRGLLRSCLDWRSGRGRACQREGRRELQSVAKSSSPGWLPPVPHSPLSPPRPLFPTMPNPTRKGLEGGGTVAYRLALAQPRQPSSSEVAAPLPLPLPHSLLRPGCSHSVEGSIGDSKSGGLEWGLLAEGRPTWGGEERFPLKGSRVRACAEVGWWSASRGEVYRRPRRLGGDANVVVLSKGFEARLGLDFVLLLFMPQF